MKKLRKMEWWILICAIILCGIGLVALFSASYDSNLDEFKKQAVWIGISLGIMIGVMFIDYKILIKLSPILYGIAIISLIAVLFTKPISGARSWFVIGDDLFSFQPAEMSKVFIILFLSYVISIIQRKGRSEINKITKLGIILLTSSIDVYIRDLEYIINFFISMLFYATPVLYSMDMFPSKIQKIFHLNPMTTIIESYRNIFYYHQVPNMLGLLLVFIFSLIVLFIGIKVFKKLEKGFAEEL